MAHRSAFDAFTSRRRGYRTDRHHNQINPGATIHGRSLLPPLLASWCLGGPLLGRTGLGFLNDAFSLGRGVVV